MIDQSMPRMPYSKVVMAAHSPHDIDHRPECASARPSMFRESSVQISCGLIEGYQAAHEVMICPSKRLYRRRCQLGNQGAGAGKRTNG